MKLSQIGEFGLIERLAKIIGKPSSAVVVGVGDDCAVLEFPGYPGNRKFGTYQLITTDTLVENVHFKLQGKRGELKKLGHKAMLANISDIAAMGGKPTFAVVTIGTGKNCKVAAIENLYRGMLSLAKKYGIQIVGGDTVSSPQGLIISLTLLGEVEKEYLLTRSGARVGDIIMVTGKLGAAAKNKFELISSNFRPRLNEARLIARSKVSTAMIDSSDGFVRSVIEICRASKVGAKIKLALVPIASRATLKQALFGGEEYELIFTVKRAQALKLKALQKKMPVKLSVVGEIAEKGKGVRLVDADGKEKYVKNGGYDHFQ